MVGELVFHLGDRKTGSTSIQRVLATRGFTSDEASLLYPAEISHIPLAMTLTEKGQTHLREKRFGAVARQLAGSQADVAVISAEHFEEVKPTVLRKNINRFFPDHADNLRLIAYVRPHADRVVSSYAQVVKMGKFSGSLEQFHQKTYRKGRFLYTARFQAWRDEFGDRFELRPMIRASLYMNCVVRDFLNFALGGKSFQLLKDPENNESLCVEDLAILQNLHMRLKKTEMKPLVRTGLTKRLAELLAEQPPHPVRTKPLLHAELARVVAADYRGDAEALDAAFFEGHPMAAALDATVVRAPQKAFSLALGDHLSKEELRGFRQLSTLVVKLSEAQADDLPAYFRNALARRLKAAREDLAPEAPLARPSDPAKGRSRKAKRRQKDKGN